MLPGHRDFSFADAKVPGRVAVRIIAKVRRDALGGALIEIKRRGGEMIERLGRRFRSRQKSGVGAAFAELAALENLDQVLAIRFYAGDPGGLQSVVELAERGGAV